MTIDGQGPGHAEGPLRRDAALGHQADGHQPVRLDRLRRVRPTHARDGAQPADRPAAADRQTSSSRLGEQRFGRRLQRLPDRRDRRWAVSPPTSATRTSSTARSRARSAPRSTRWSASASCARLPSRTSRRSRAKPASSSSAANSRFRSRRTKARSRIEFKPFGVGLGYTPVVLSEGRISLQLSVEVSELSQQGGFQSRLGRRHRSRTPGRPITGQTITIPALKVRRAETTVEIPSGGSLVIAGLIQEQTKQTPRRRSRRQGHPGPRRAVPQPRLPERRDRAGRDRHALPGRSDRSAELARSGSRLRHAARRAHRPVRQAERSLRRAGLGRGQDAAPKGASGFIFD